MDVLLFTRSEPARACPRQKGQSLGNGKLGKTGNAADIELARDTLPVSFNRPDAYPQANGNLLVAQTFGNPDQHLALTGAELLVAPSIPSAMHKLVEGHLSDLRAKEAPTRCHRFDSFDQLR